MCAYMFVTGTIINEKGSYEFDRDQEGYTDGIEGRKGRGNDAVLISKIGEIILKINY